MSLISFRKNGTAVPTPVWFSEKDDKLYVMTRSDSGKYKRIRNNPQVRIAPCTMRGKITGPEVAGRRANSSSRRLARSPKNHPAKILAHPNHCLLEQNQRLSGDRNSE